VAIKRNNWRLLEMFEILFKETLAPQVKLLKIKAMEISKKAKPGQFVIIRVSERCERIPLTINDFDPNNGTITIVVQEVGLSTKLLGQMNAGEKLRDVAGPLGKPSEIDKFGNVVCVAGGLGTAVIYPIARSLYNVGNCVITIIGAKSKDYLILEKEMRKFSHNLYITTDDGSKGLHGFVTDALKEVLHDIKVDRVIAIGPAIMMKNVTGLTKTYKIDTIVSLNPVMIDGTGMCGGCRVNVDGKTKFTCVDGPEFNGHKVDFDLLISRLSQYRDEEKTALYECKLGDY
jgi:NAD(P)H-flavin reductase